MNCQRDKDLAWIIVLMSFLVFLLSALTCSFLEGASRLPVQVTMANASLDRSFLSVFARFIRYSALAGMLYGAVGIVFWPPGARP